MEAFNIIKHYLDSHKSSRYLLRSFRNLFLPMQINSAHAKTIGIEVSSICNAKCIFCLYKLNYRKKQLMSPGDFRTIAETCVRAGYEYLDLTSLSGELFVHPDAIEIIRAAKAAGFRHIGTYTNAFALWRHDVRGLLSSGIDALLISFPGFRPEEFERIYQVNAFEDFKHSISLLLHEHSALNSKVQIVFEPRTYRSKGQLEADDFYCKVIAPHLGEYIHMREPLRAFDTWGGEITQADLLDGMMTDVNSIKSLWPLKEVYLCNRLLSIGVMANGDVRLCNCRYDVTIETEKDSLFIDNLRNYDSFLELMKENDHKISQIRTDFVYGKLPALCAKCPFYIPIKITAKTVL